MIDESNRVEEKSSCVGERMVIPNGPMPEELKVALEAPQVSIPIVVVDESQEIILELASALHRLAEGFGIPDDGPDENVTGAISLVRKLRVENEILRDENVRLAGEIEKSVCDCHEWPTAKEMHDSYVSIEAENKRLVALDEVVARVLDHQSIFYQFRPQVAEELSAMLRLRKNPDEKNELSR